MTSRIYVVPILDPPPELIHAAATRFRDIFDTGVEIVPPSFDARAAHDKVRGQYNSTSLLARLLEMLPGPDCRIVGVTNIDLFIPILTFVFGEAQLDGPAAIVSSCRLHNEFYGLPEDFKLLVDRLEKECLHEIGHTFNLTHCESYDCVMHSSTSVEEIDIKGRVFCPSCSVDMNEDLSAG
jgi:archaemetzincin